MPIDLINDIVVERDFQGYGKCIRAPESVFRLVAGILLKLATEKPDASGMSELNGALDVNHITQASFFSFALQCLGDALCGDDDMPQNLRTKPDDSCVLQQEQGGDFVDVFDFGACLELWLNLSSERDAAVGHINNAPMLANAVWSDFDSKYTGTSASYDPDLVISGDTADAHRAALCRALTKIVKDYASDSAKAKTALVDNLNRAALATAIGVGLVSLLAAIAALPTAGASVVALASFFGGAGYLALGGAVGGLTGTGLAVWAQVVKDTELVVFESTTAVNRLACLWYEQLETEADISMPEYQADIDVSGETGHTPALYNAIKHLMKEPLSYAVFLKTWKSEIAFGGAIDDLDPDCGCYESAERVPVNENRVTDTGMVSDGIIEHLGGTRWRITAVNQGSYWLASLSDVSGRSFVLENIDYVNWPSYPVCQHWIEQPGNVYWNDGCGFSEANYTGQTLTGVVWTGAGPNPIEFDFVAPE